MNPAHPRPPGTSRLSRYATASLTKALRLLLHLHDHPEMQLVGRFLALEPPLYAPALPTGQGHHTIGVPGQAWRDWRGPEEPAELPMNPSGARRRRARHLQTSTPRIPGDI